MYSFFFFFKDLIDRLLVVDASERYTADEILQHFWIKVTGSRHLLTFIFKRNKNDVS